MNLVSSKPWPSKVNFECLSVYCVSCYVFSICRGEWCIWRYISVFICPLQFEYQQAQLEAEIENLSWKVERADSYERGVVGGEGELSASDRGVRAHIAKIVLLY